MAPPAAAAVHHRQEGPPRDVERFRELLTRGPLGFHAYVVLLGLDAYDGSDLLKAVSKGFPYRTFEHLRRNLAVPVDDLGALVAIPRRTLTRRKSEGRFLPDESDRLLRAGRLLGAALALFEGDHAAALAWLATSHPALGRETPLALARTDLGAREVERLIHRLEHGVYS